MTRPISEMTRAELVDEVVRLQQRNADLAAHVEFCHKVMTMVENGPEYLVARQYRALRMARERKPETSLAHLKAEWQTEALVGALVACAKANSAAEVGLIVDDALAAHRKQGGAGK